MWRAIARVRERIDGEDDANETDDDDDAKDDPFISRCANASARELTRNETKTKDAGRERPSARARASERRETKRAILSAPRDVAVVRFGDVVVGESATEDLDVVNDTAMAQVGMSESGDAAFGGGRGTDSVD